MGRVLRKDKARSVGRRRLEDHARNHAVVELLRDEEQRPDQVADARAIRGFGPIPDALKQYVTALAVTY